MGVLGYAIVRATGEILWEAILADLDFSNGLAYAEPHFYLAAKYDLPGGSGTGQTFLVALDPATGTGVGRAELQVHLDPCQELASRDGELSAISALRRE